MRATIAYIDHAVQVGGAEKSLVELIAHLDRERFQPVVMHRAEAVWASEAERAGARLCPGVPESELYDEKRGELRSGVLASLRRLMRASGPVRVLGRELRALAPDLVHTNSTKMHLMGGAAARLRRLPVVWHMRDLLIEPGARSWLRRAVRTVRPEVIAISEAVAAQFEGLRCRVHVVHNGVPLEQFAPGEAPSGLRYQLGIKPGAPVACVVGRLTPWKGHPVLLSAWARVSRRMPEARLLVVGEVAFWEQSYEQELREVAVELGLEECVRWLGFREDVPELLRASDLLVLPSIDEPFGRVIIEAMATELPVVATNSGGVPEIVVDEQTGLLVPPGEVDPLAEAIAELLSDPARARQMGAAGRRRALERFDVRRVAQQVGVIYDEMLSG
jgi:glycosyltransferase involved in cell wall biosynthesis